MSAGGEGAAGGQGEGHQGVAGGAEQGADQAPRGAGALRGGQETPRLCIQPDQSTTQNQAKSCTGTNVRSKTVLEQMYLSKSVLEHKYLYLQKLHLNKCTFQKVYSNISTYKSCI